MTRFLVANVPAMRREVGQRSTTLSMFMRMAFAFVVTPALVVLAILALPIVAVTPSGSSLSPEASTRSDRGQQCQNKQSPHRVSQLDLQQFSGHDDQQSNFDGLSPGGMLVIASIDQNETPSPSF